MLKQTDKAGFEAHGQMPRIQRFLMDRQTGQSDVIDEAIGQIQVAFAHNGYAPIVFHLHAHSEPCGDGSQHPDTNHMWFIEEPDDLPIDKVTVIP